MKDPEKALNALGLSFQAPGGGASRVDSTLRVWVGHDLFYFADPASRDRFVKDPLALCHTLTDPVTQRRFASTPKSPQLNYHGRRYFFASDSTRSVFRGRPDFYAKRGPMDEATPMGAGLHGSH